jgi:hypothetical protein
MALSTIAVPADPKRDARARELVDQVGSWPLFTLKQPFGCFEAGTVFRRAYGSDGARYLVNAVACECPDYQQSQNICKHVRAVVLWEARQQPAPAPRPSYADLFPSCKGGCGDVADGRDGYCDRCASDREWQARRAATTPFALNSLAE